jgi:TolB-like protein/DNA-binding winged helix-turn-helix (wHTH) protein/Tfp pilus assembly protein PilF
VPGPSYQFGPFRLDPGASQLSGAQGPIPLAPKVFETLLLLVENKGKTVTKDELLRRVWPDTFVEENSLARNISTLRHALGDGENGSRFIVTVPKRGYRFVSEVRVLEQGDTGSGSAKHLAQETEERRQHIQKSRAWVRGGAAMLLAIGVAAVLAILSARSRLSEIFTGQRIQSLAVLPLDNVSGDAGQEYFADGMTDTLITDLAKIHALRVVSRTSTMQYKGTRKSVPEIASELGVDAIVEGTILRSGNQVRVTAQLIRAKREGHLWAEMYQRDIGDAMTLQAEIAQTIADRISAQVTPGERAELAAVRRVDPDAYELYLKGRYYWNKRDPAGLTKAKEYFERTIEKSPNFALGYVGLADTYNVMSDSFIITPTEALSKSREVTLKALQIDNSLAEAHASLGYVHFELDWDWPAAEQEFRRAIELNSNYATAHQWYSMYLAAMARCNDAIAEFRRAEQLDPLSLIIRTDGAAIFFWCRQLDPAFEELRQVIEMAPGFPQAHAYITAAYAARGQFAECEAEFEKARELAGGSVLSPIVFKAWLDAQNGKPDEARKLLGQARNSVNESGWDEFFIASTYGTLGDLDSAFQYLEKAYRNRVYWLIYLRVEPRLDPLRKDPRFQDLLKRMHLD